MTAFLDPALFAAPTPKPPVRIELYNNGPKPKKPKTQFGLVVDINNSKARFNINFEVLSNYEYALLTSDINLTTQEQSRIHQVCQTFTNMDYDESPNPHIYMASAKKNKLAGTGLHNLKAGAVGYDHDVAAILVYNGPTTPPVVHLFVGGEETVVDSGWERVTKSSSEVLEWKVTF